MVPVAVIYGFNPSLLFEISPTTADELNLMNGIMGLYLGFAIIWALGAWNTRFYKVALWSNIVFMLGMGLGRVWGLFLDPIPSSGYLLGAFAELFLAFYGLWVLKRKPFTTETTSIRLK